MVGTSQSSVGGVTQRLRSLSNTSMAGQRCRRGYPPWQAQYLNIGGWFSYAQRRYICFKGKMLLLPGSNFPSMSLVLPVAGLAEGHISVCVILAQSWN